MSPIRRSHDSSKSKRSLSTQREKVERVLIASLREKVPPSESSLAKKAGVPRSTCLKIIGILKREGILSVEKVGRQRRCKLTDFGVLRFHSCGQILPAEAQKALEGLLTGVVDSVRFPEGLTSNERSLAEGIILAVHVPPRAFEVWPKLRSAFDGYASVLLSISRIQALDPSGQVVKITVEDETFRTSLWFLGMTLLGSITPIDPGSTKGMLLEDRKKLVSWVQTLKHALAPVFRPYRDLDDIIATLSAT